MRTSEIEAPRSEVTTHNSTSPVRGPLAGETSMMMPGVQYMKALVYTCLVPEFSRTTSTTDVSDPLCPGSIGVTNTPPWSVAHELPPRRMREGGGALLIHLRNVPPPTAPLHGSNGNSPEDSTQSSIVCV